MHLARSAQNGRAYPQYIIRPTEQLSTLVAIKKENKVVGWKLGVAKILGKVITFPAYLSEESTDRSLLNISAVCLLVFFRLRILDPQIQPGWTTKMQRHLSPIGQAQEHRLLHLLSFPGAPALGELRRSTWGGSMLL